MISTLAKEPLKEIVDDSEFLHKPTDFNLISYRKIRSSWFVLFGPTSVFVHVPTNVVRHRRCWSQGASKHLHIIASPARLFDFHEDKGWEEVGAFLRFFFGLGGCPVPGHSWEMESWEGRGANGSLLGVVCAGNHIAWKYFFNLPPRKDLQKWSRSRELQGGNHKCTF